MQLTHLNANGEAHMVDVGAKNTTHREAVASGRIMMQPQTLQLLTEGGLPKGDVIATARIAGIQAAKRTHELIPLCHSLALSKVTVDFELDTQASCVHVSAMCRVTGQTGVEMEALTAVSVACLTLYDMCKAVDKSMSVEGIQLDSKVGGKSGDYQRMPDDKQAPPIVTGEHAPGEVPVDAPCVGECVRVKFLAELRERLGHSEMSIPLEALETQDIAGLKALLAVRADTFDVLRDQRTLSAVNQVMVNDSARLTDNDEVAFFPPVTGG